ncbi:ABC transporter substrate-binding protein [Amycolatopsis carbonis]|uniref:ABC transporter substrate-binding protein n=1 Tax=Amycolatopsis carbonis TaxID=715471 RepID=A0A9Y2ICS4_9PSEU|nr:ABC transporter substrate-binding protein [Amycolatopsis sp. 2-15]WIX77357.1 ABC transporter substrate-binding protein [Amycolatopsis sp. 2-15]
MPTLDRRGFLRLTGAAAGAAVLTACGPNMAGKPGSSGGGLKINSFGGTFQSAVQSTVADAYTTKTGVGVDLITAISSDALTKMRAANNAFDLAYLDLAPLYQAKAAGLLQKLDRAQLPSLSELYPLAVDSGGYWVAELASMTGIVYHTERVKTPPKSWKDLWDPKYRGKVAISNVSGTAGYHFLAMAARLNGGSETAIDRGFAAIASLKPNLAAIYSTPDEMSKLLTSGEADIGVWYADRTSALKSSGAPVAFVRPQEGATAILSAMCLPAASSRAKDAHAYLDFQISSAVNGKFVQAIAEGPTNSKVTLPQQFLSANYVPYGQQEISSLIQLDSEAISKNLSAWITRWQQEVAG